jgi:Spy/CpxP family protein refolding chaperone
MSLGKSILSASLIFATGSIILAADAPKATPTTKPAPTTRPTKAKKLVEPWSMLKDLTPEQTAQIEKIHADALEQTKKIIAKETDDINAILTPQQQTELKIDEAQKRLGASEKSAERRKEAATQMVK